MPDSHFDLSGAEARTKIKIQEQERKRDQTLLSAQTSPISRNVFLIRQLLVILFLIIAAVIIYHFFH
jgi:hypothetical protein